MRLRELGLSDDGWVGDHGAAMPVARRGEACRAVLAEQREIRDMDAVARRQCAAGVAKTRSVCPDAWNLLP
jgi:hypothetical protein